MNKFRNKGFLTLMGLGLISLVNGENMKTENIFSVNTADKTFVVKKILSETMGVDRYGVIKEDSIHGSVFVCYSACNTKIILKDTIPCVKTYRESPDGNQWMERTKVELIVPPNTIFKIETIDNKKPETLVF